MLAGVLEIAVESIVMGSVAAKALVGMHARLACVVDFVGRILVIGFIGVGFGRANHLMICVREIQCFLLLDFGRSRLVHLTGPTVLYENVILLLFGWTLSCLVTIG